MFVLRLCQSVCLYTSAEDTQSAFCSHQHSLLAFIEAVTNRLENHEALCLRSHLAWSHMSATVKVGYSDYTCSHENGPYDGVSLLANHDIRHSHFHYIVYFADGSKIVKLLFD